MRLAPLTKALLFWVLFYLIGFAFLLAYSHANALGPDRYDPEIRAASEQWLPGSDWLRYRALLYQESRLNPNAVSPVGAEGIAQFMPDTWREVMSAFGEETITPRAADVAIKAGAYYLAGRIRFWTEERAYMEKRRLAEACYNAGCGNILQAQRECRQGFRPCGGACRLWPDISLYLPRVTGDHAQETINYVRLIDKWHRAMRMR